MKIEHIKLKIMPETYEQRIYFCGYIIRETIQDAINSSYEMSYEKLGKILISDIKELGNENN